mmetsp:Transcript_38222/g.108063  ORF Transcript_38222/g.108063 Transcript_38222/m.108063 type:complete len:232 (-) Transcript_38222:550-1245(-)
MWRGRRCSRRGSTSPWACLSLGGRLLNPQVLLLELQRHCLTGAHGRALLQLHGDAIPCGHCIVALHNSQAVIHLSGGEINDTDRCALWYVALVVKLGFHVRTLQRCDAAAWLVRLPISGAVVLGGLRGVYDPVLLAWLQHWPPLVGSRQSLRLLDLVEELLLLALLVHRAQGHALPAPVFPVLHGLHRQRCRDLRSGGGHCERQVPHGRRRHHGHRLLHHVQWVLRIERKQ